MTLKEISQRLKEYDDQLRVIPSRRLHELTQQYRVEVHVQKQIIVSDKPVCPITGTTPTWEEWWRVQDPDDRLSAQEDNCLLCFTFWPNQMDSRIFYTVLMTDSTLMRQRVTEQTDRIKAKKERAMLAFGDQVEGRAREWHRFNSAAATLPMGSLLHPKSRGIPDAWDA